MSGMILQDPCKHVWDVTASLMAQQIFQMIEVDALLAADAK